MTKRTMGFGLKIHFAMTHEAPGQDFGRADRGVGVFDQVGSVVQGHPVHIRH